jgi:DNA-binding NarL/FixJ family response regulator
MNQPVPRRVVIVDDQVMLREVLAEVLRGVPECEIVGQASDGREAIDLCLKERPDLVILDIMLPGLNGVEVLLRLKDDLPGCRILVISGMDNPVVIQRLINSGADGIVRKNSGLQVFYEGLRRVLDGKVYHCPETLKFMRQMELSPIGDLRKLSSREREVLQLLAEGHTAREIGTRLTISSKTVENHRQNLMQKLGIHDVVGLTRFAIKNGLVSIN